MCNRMHALELAVRMPSVSFPRGVQAAMWSQHESLSSSCQRYALSRCLHDPTVCLHIGKRGLTLRRAQADATINEHDETNQAGKNPSGYDRLTK